MALRIPVFRRTQPAKDAPDTREFVKLGSDVESVVAALVQYVADKFAASSLGSLAIRTHALLTSLSADDHKQYALLAGRSGGQTLNGGTAAGDNLTLQSTASVTRGTVTTPDIIWQTTDPNVGAVSFTAAPWSTRHGLLLAWNKSNSQGEFDLVNLSGFGSDGGFALYDRDTLLMRVRRSGMVGVGIDPSYPLETHTATNRNLSVFDANTQWTGAVGVFAGNDANSAAIPLLFNASNYQFSVGNVGIGGPPAASGALDVQSTTGALIVPRMTTAQKNALTAVDGMIVYDTSLAAFYKRQAGAWVAF